MPAGLIETVRALVRAARDEGRSALTEPEGLEIVQALGIGVPRSVVFRAPADVAGLDLAALPGERVVLKIVSATILHKSDAGGVRFLAKDPAAIREAAEALSVRLPRCDLRGFLLSAFVPHDPSLGGQLLLGMRWTEDFGPVVTFGPGGVHAEFLARNLRPGRDSAILSPVLASSASVEAALEATAITPAATGRLRGQASRMTLADLRDLVLRLLAFASATMPDLVSEFEINPLVWAGDGPVALDALVRVGAPAAEVETPRPIAKVGRLLRPRSIAVVGVSQGENPGRTILRNILRQGFPPAAVTVVKPGLEAIEGCRCVPDVASLPGPVDLFVVCVRAEEVPDLVEAAIRGRRAEGIILIAGGLGERRGSEVHVERVRRAIRASRDENWRGPVVNGGNCLGVRSAPGHFDTLFIPEHKLRFPPGATAPLALISQSGAFAIAHASKLAELTPRYLVTLGNQLDLTVGDYLTFLKEDLDVEVYACYVEGFRPGDGRRWVEAASEIGASGRAVLLYRAGRTPAGAQASASHTASIAGDYAVTRALATAAGAVVAETLEEFDDLVQLFVLLRNKEVRGWRLGALSNAGFEVVAMADNLGPLCLADFTAVTRARLERLLRQRRLDTIVGARNLLDLTPIVDDAAYEDAVRTVLADPEVDVGVVGCVPFTGALQTVARGEGYAEDLTSEDSIVRRLIRLHRASRKAWVGVVDAGRLYDPMVRLLQAEGVPTFRSADRALRCLARYVAWRQGPRGAAAR